MKNNSHLNADSPCLICGQARLFVVKEFAALPRITSDCHPFPAGGELAVCENCATVQKIPNQRWLNEIETIYADYAAYSVAGGEEQLVLDPQSGEPRKRSDVLMRAVSDSGDLPAIARALDIGCGHGVTLMAMAKVFPEWELFGYEIDESKRDHLYRIENFKQLYTGDFSRIDGTFNFISMIHSLEHFIDPLRTLRALRRVAAPGGRLFIEVCNVDENPFDLLVADHLTHFSPGTLAFIANQAGFGAPMVKSSWVKKELSLLATKSENEDVRIANVCPSGRKVHEQITASVSWLDALISSAREVACASDSFGIFGTSIAGTWLATTLGDRVSFFVDEDPHRIGKDYMGKPIVAPQSVARESTVFMALAPMLAQAIKHRLSHLGLDLILPSTFYE